MSTDARMVHVFNRQEKCSLPDELLSSLEGRGDRVMALLGGRYPARVKLPGLVNVSLIDDPEMQRVHAQFMDNPDPTDVITFPYGEEGEILISAETATRKAAELEVSFQREITLYLVHGLLHLAGYEDASMEGRMEMEGLQESLLNELLGSL